MKKSPFPGMDPWLEARWGDVHTRLTTYACDQLQPQLPAGLYAHIEEYVSVESPDEAEGRPLRFEPDVRVIERKGEPDDGGGVAVATEVATEPLIVPLRSEPETLRYIKIIDSESGERVVTTIEFLSRANKTSTGGRRQYRAKQKKMMEGGVNLVEVDLLRSGSWVMAVSQSCVPQKYRRPYRICVVRATKPWQAEIYSAPLQRPLPTISIPLRADDKDISLHLQPLIETAYINGGYARYLDYSQEPRPALTGPDAQWADQLLREKQLR